MTQAQAARRAGLAQSTWSWLELDGYAGVTLSTWGRAGAAVSARFDAFLRQATPTDRPRDAVHLRHQDLVIRTAAQGGWTPLPEHPLDADISRSRCADVLLRRAREHSLIEVWDWFDDVGAAARGWQRRLDAVERRVIARMTPDDRPPRVSGLWVVRGTQRNRQVVREHRNFFRALLPGAGRAWLAALASAAAPMPAAAALLWVTVDGDRLYAAVL